MATDPWVLVGKLREENASLRKQIAEMQKRLADEDPMPMCEALSVLTPMQTMFAKKLASGKTVSTYELRKVKDSSTASVKTTMCFVRKRLKHYGIEIDSIYGSGYTVASGLDRLRDMVKPSQVKELS